MTKKENKTIKDRIIRENRNIFELEEDYYKGARVGNFWCNSYIEYRNKGNRKILSVEEYLNEIKSYLKDTIMISKDLTSVNTKNYIFLLLKMIMMKSV